MTSLQIADADIPCLDGKVAIVTGGASGIGLAAAKILVLHGATVHIQDLRPPDEARPPRATFTTCDTTSWFDLRRAFDAAGHVDIAIANAGVSEECDYFADTLDAEGELLEPKWNVLEVNYRGVLNFVKLAVSSMRKGGVGGSIVITSSATAYSPEQSLPVYSATKLALIGLVRALRSSLPRSNISINAVSPAATITRLLPVNLATPLIAAGLPISSAHMVGLAVVYSAVARQERRVEAYGKDSDGAGEGAGKWNGRVIWTLGDDYTEMEEPIARLRSDWFMENNMRLTRMQQRATDFRDIV